LHKLTIYFTLHRFRPELRNEDFLRAFRDCDIFLVEAADQWPSNDWECQYNELSQGRRDALGGLIESLLTPPPFQRELECRIYCSGKKIVLERSRFSLASDLQGEFSLVTDLQSGLNTALASHRMRCEEKASRMVQRDRDLVDLIENLLRSDVRLLTFRGAAHQRWLCRLLRSKSIEPDVIRFLPGQTADERVLSPLTNGEKVSDDEILRQIYVQLNAKENLQKHLEVETQAEEMTEEDLRTNLTEYASSKAGHSD
jgi:hypothetical protein